MRREVTLSASNPRFSVELPFKPSTIVVLNNTDVSCYMNVGRLTIPNAQFFDREILPAANGIPSNVALPNNSFQFAGFLPTPTDTTKNVKIIFQGTADPFSNRPLRSFPFGSGGGGIGSMMMDGFNRFKNYMEFRLNAANLTKIMDLPFVADMVFILNNSDAFLYIHEGGLSNPSPTFSDMTIPPTSYTILTPHGGSQYTALLDNPSAKDCFIIFAFGYADEWLRIKEYLNEWDWYLPPLTIPGLQYYFNWNFYPPPMLTCTSGLFQTLLDFRLSDYGFLSFGAGSIWIAGLGWFCQNGLSMLSGFRKSIASTPIVALGIEIMVVGTPVVGYVGGNNGAKFWTSGLLPVGYATFAHLAGLNFTTLDFGLTGSGMALGGYITSATVCTNVPIVI